MDRKTIRASGAIGAAIVTATATAVVTASGALLGAVALGHAGPAQAQAATGAQQVRLVVESDPVLTMGEVVISQAELDAHMRSLPEQGRARAVADLDRIDQLLQNLLLKKALSARARQAGLLEDPVVAAAALSAVSGVLAEEQLRRHVASHLLDDYQQQARELFLANPQRFAPENPRYSFTHVLISTADRTEAEAMRVIIDLLDRIEAGESLEELADEYSDDTAAADSGGSYENRSLDELDRNFARALAELEQPGDISGPVRSRFGWHIIRLDARQQPPEPKWEDVRERALEMARNRHENRIRKAYFAELIDPDAIEIVPGSIERFQKRQGYDAEKARQALQNAD